MGKTPKIEYENFLKEEECIQELNAGFLEYFGEDKKEFFAKLAEELIPMGKKIGKKFYHISSYLSTGRFSISLQFAKSAKEKKQMLAEMEIFFTKKEIKEISKDEYKPAPHLFQYMKGYGAQQQRCCKELKEENLKAITSKSWKYFKKFPIYDRCKSVSIYGEGGLQLDLWDKESIERHKGDLSYRYIERIPAIYVRIGIMLGRQELREELLPKIISNINENTTHAVKQFVRDYIHNVSPSPVTDETLLYIQEKTGLTDDFLTSEQINTKINKWASTEEGKQKLKDLTEYFKNSTKD